MTPSFFNIVMNEAGAEILKSLRAPEFLLPTLVMPVSFYTLFSIVLPGGSQNPHYFLATFGVFAVMGPSIFGFGASVANERDRGWLTIKRAAPAPAAAYLAAKVIATVVFGAAAVALVYAAAGFIAGVAMPRATWATLLGAHLLSVPPFIFIGLTLGFLFNANGAVAAANIVFLGLAMLGGLFVPAFLFPDLLQQFAAFLPSYRMGEIALAVIDAPGTRNPVSDLAVAGLMTAILAGIAVLAWARQR